MIMCKKTLKALTLSLVMATLMLSPLTMNGQYNEHKFGIQPWGQSSMLGREGGSGNTYGISNQTYGSSADGFGITNQTYGQNESAPLGSGLLIMAVAGACYAGMKRNKKQTKK
jgi:hypothetical protein